MLGRLVERGYLTRDHKLAGERFAALHRRAVGVALHAKGLSFDAETRGFYGLEESDFQIERQAQITAAYREARAVVQKHSRQTLDAVMNVACYERPTQQVERLRAGLALLVAHFGLAERVAA